MLSGWHLHFHAATPAVRRQRPRRAVLAAAPAPCGLRLRRQCDGGTSSAPFSSTTLVQILGSGRVPPD
jgi:hypothetical protein